MTAPAAWIRAGALAAALALGPRPARADFAAEERAREAARTQDEVWRTLVGQKIVAEARRHIGEPYVWGGKSEATGFDCSGYTAYVFQRLGIRLSLSAQGQFQQGQQVEREALRPGDLVFFTGAGSPFHVGIYEGDGWFLHAPGTGKTITRARLDSPYFSLRFLGARRVIPSLDEERRLRLRAQATPPAPPPQGRP